MTPRAVIILVGLMTLSAPIFAPGQTGVVDDLGYVFPPGPAPQRIVSLAPNITEILFALGLDKEIVGVTRYCDYPPQVLTREKVGGLIDPDLEKIRALNPDLVIAFRGNPLPVIQRMRGLGLRVFVLEMGETLESIFLFLEKIGSVTQRSKESAGLVRRLRTKFEHIEKALQTARAKPRVFLALQGMGLWTCGRKSYLTDLVSRAGGANIAGRIDKRWVNYSREQILEDQPEVIVLLVKTARDFSPAKEWLDGQAYLQSVPAIRLGRIYPLDENKTSRYGPRLLDALDDLARILHPESFRPPPPRSSRPLDSAGAEKDGVRPARYFIDKARRLFYVIGS